jgi:ATP-dependent DNA helicase RecG
MNLKDPVTVLKGVGESSAQKFAVLGIKTIDDLINYYPRRYEDYSELSPINKLHPGMVSLKVVIKNAKGRYVKRGMHITEAIASDTTGSVRLIWFNQPYRADSIKSDKQYYVSGNYELSRNRFSLINPALELVSDLPANTARILSVYRETKALDSRQIRLAIKQVIDLINKYPESLPSWIIKDFKLVSKASALKSIHMPENMKDLESAKRRLGFEEVFRLSLASLLNKQQNKQELALPIEFKEDLAKDFVSHLPFNLTNAQRKTTWQTYIDMQKEVPMNRLIEGDVGAGKTVVATMAALMVIDNKKQVALMAPTELLARQHADTIHKLLKPLGRDDKVVLLVGSLSTAQKDKAHEAIKKGKASFIIGTQAIIQDKVDMHDLALVIIDEQHRFGVEQRKSLMAKAGHMPHVLSLSATPIPRSLALTLYGELDISLLDEKPANRQPIKTLIIQSGERDRTYQKIDKEIETGRQVFVVCPSISESLSLDMQAAEKVYEEFKSGVFKHRRIGLLHGKLKATDKQDIMKRFVDHKLDILVSTTVIEVGVDVANASIMLIKSPERFGLAQLHQLRGRVGRGEHQGYCYLMLDSQEAPLRRLRALVSSNDGFKLAELDLDLRGPGAIYGTSQHGALDLRIAKLNDLKLIHEATKAAKLFIDKNEKLIKYKELKTQVNRLRAVTNLN